VKPTSKEGNYGTALQKDQTKMSAFDTVIKSKRLQSNSRDGNRGVVEEQTKTKRRLFV